jgi:uncharacterized membrane protein YesL
VRQNAHVAEFVDKAGTFILANLFWVLLAIPIITIPAATAGLFATLSPLARGESSEVFRDFFAGIRQHWRIASLVGVINLLVGGLVILNVLIFRMMGAPQIIATLSQSVTIFVAMLLILANLYIWPLMVAFDLSLRDLVTTALKLVFLHAAWSILMLVLAVIPFIITLFLPTAVLIFATFSASALLVTRAAWWVIRLHENEMPLG